MTSLCSTVSPVPQVLVRSVLRCVRGGWGILRVLWGSGWLHLHKRSKSLATWLVSPQDGRTPRIRSLLGDFFYTPRSLRGTSNTGKSLIHYRIMTCGAIRKHLNYGNGPNLLLDFIILPIVDVKEDVKWCNIYTTARCFFKVATFCIDDSFARMHEEQRGTLDPVEP